MLKKGEIYWVKLGENALKTDRKKYFHPIVCLEDTDENDVEHDLFKAVILSTKDTKPDAYINNEPMSLDLFVTPDNKNGYVVPEKDNEHLVKIGLLKHINKMPPKPAGMVRDAGVKWIIEQLELTNQRFINMENFTIQDYVNLFSPEALETSLKKAVKDYWSKPENRKIDGRPRADLGDDIRIQHLNYPHLCEGNLVSQFVKLVEALKNGEDKPSLHGRFEVDESIAEGNGTRFRTCEFELPGDNYEIKEDGSLAIKHSLLIHIIS